ncbi:hypothetical protein ABZW30_07725 [Kitasatospora sp. NPDC004669]|uniref:hypothetical protein n=1 Tax=Kitasatospora sp. NPDC004669 TaxID=3154555 RepID=UPI00339FF3F9
MKATKTLRRTAVGTAAGVLALVGTMVSAGAAHADTIYSGGLGEPGVLNQGDRIIEGDTQLIMQGDGNLVLYRVPPFGSANAVWVAPGTLGCGTKAIMQGDGNFVVYGAYNRVCWASNSFKTNSFQSAGVLVADKGGLKIVFTDPRQWSIITDTLRSSDPY